jgi:hypothetical protein
MKCRYEYIHIGKPFIKLLFWLRPPPWGLTCLRKLACAEIAV